MQSLSDIMTTINSLPCLAVGVGVSLWGVTEEPPESAFAVLRSGGSSPFVWRSSTGGDDGLASELVNPLLFIKCLEGRHADVYFFQYREGVNAEWFEWPPIEG